MVEGLGVESKISSMSSSSYLLECLLFISYMLSAFARPKLVLHLDSAQPQLLQNSWLCVVAYNYIFPLILEVRNGFKHFGLSNRSTPGSPSLGFRLVYFAYKDNTQL